MKKFVKELRIVVGLIAESASFAFFSIKSDKLRTFLSLFGVTVGIFSIVAVFCAVDSLKSNIMEGVRSFGSDGGGGGRRAAAVVGLSPAAGDH